MLLSIVIVNWNTSDLLRDCLTSVQQQIHSWLPEAIETIVVDNGSTDGSVQMVQKLFPSVRLVQNPDNFGFARANNQAIRQTTGRYVLLLNSDTKLLANALIQLVEFMEEQSQAGAVGPRLLNWDASLQPSCHPMLTPEREFWRLSFLDSLIRWATYDVHNWNTTIPRQVEVLKGACFLLRQEALEEVGLLDESYFMYTEEVDLCHRLARQGWQIWWEPRAEVVHYGEASSKQMAEEMYLQLYRSKVQFFRKFGEERQAARFKFLLQIVYWPRLLIASLLRLFSQRRAEQHRTYRRLLDELPQM